jgi:hypothetical protein
MSVEAAIINISYASPKNSFEEKTLKNSLNFNILIKIYLKIYFKMSDK